MKPMLSGKAELEKIVYPVIASPKLDGIRCLCIGGQPMSRTLKPIPNEHVRRVLGTLAVAGLDGELMLPKGDFNKVQSAVMSRAGEPEFMYHVFDAFTDEQGTDMTEVGFTHRYRHVQARVKAIDAPCVVRVPHHRLNNERELQAALARYEASGYEGLMLRHPNGRYKQGRSTVKEGILLKVKTFHDTEGVLLEIIEKMHNSNKATKDELGHTKRSNAKAGMVPAGTAGALVVRWKGKEFKVGFGPGLDDTVKADWWARRKKLVGHVLTFRYQELSADGVPRFGKALGFRYDL